MQLADTYPKYLPLHYAVVLVLLGAASVYVQGVASLAWLAIIICTMYGFAIGDLRWLWYGVAMSPGAEVWSRMARAPLVPHEIGKYYLLLVIVLLLIQHTRRHSHQPLYHIGTFILLCLVPGLIVAFSVFNFEYWVLNALGVIELGLLLIFSARERWSIEKYCSVLQLAIVPMLPILVYLTLKTPDFDDINFKLGSNFKTSGNFGSNQVSTILGMGLVLTTLLTIVRRPLFRVSWLNYLLIALLLFRGLLTFSRGGIITALLAITIAILYMAFINRRLFARTLLAVVVLASLGTFIFIKVNDLTKNQLLLRYQGETAGTLSGSKQRTINTITSSRLLLAQTDWRIFKDNIWFGAGPGMSKDLRSQYGFIDIVSHTEFTRLLSEHGMGGMLVTIILIVFPFYWVRKQRLRIWRAMCSSLFAFALLTSVHSAMRTNTTVVCFVLAAMPVYLLRKSSAARDV